MRPLRAVASGVLLAGALLLAGCGGAPPPAPASASAPAPEGPLAPDVDYVGMMIPHHDQGLLLTSLVPERTASPELARLAFTMDRQQVEELGQFQGLLRLWGRPVPGPQVDPGMAQMMGMASAPELDRLTTLRGAAFDQEWIRVMVRHHQGAVDMSRGLLAGPHGRVAGTSAETIAAVQQEQIAAMRAIATRSP